MSAIKRLYTDETLGIIPRDTDLIQVRREFREELEQAKSYVLEELERRIAQLRWDLEALEEASVRRDEFDKDNLDARHTQRADDLNSMLERRLEASMEDLGLQLGHCRADVKKLRTNMNDKITEKKKELATQFGEDKAQLLGKIEQAVEALNSEIQKDRAKLEEGFTGAEGSYKMERKIERQQMYEVFSDLRKRLERHDEQIAKANSAIDSRLRHERERSDAQMTSLRKDTEEWYQRLEINDSALGENIEAISNVQSRHVEWVIDDVQQKLLASKAKNLFSPRFTTGGELGLQLELQVVKADEKPPEGYETGDCIISLWARKGAKITFRVRMGDVSSAIFDHDFNGWEPYRSSRIWFMGDHIGKDGTLRVGLDVMEAFRLMDNSLHRPASAGKTSTSGEAQVLEEGSIYLRRQVNNRLPEVVEGAVNLMKSHMLRRIEWRLDGASSLRACYGENKCICSRPFMAAGLEDLQLVFYPSGVAGTRPGYCSFFLACPNGLSTQHLQAWLRLGKQRWEALPEVGKAEVPVNFCGRMNFCRYDNCLDSGNDTLYLVLEVQEAPQEVLHLTSQQEPWRSSTSVSPPPKEGGKGRGRPPQILRGIPRSGTGGSPARQQRQPSQRSVQRSATSSVMEDVPRAQTAPHLGNTSLGHGYESANTSVSEMGGSRVQKAATDGDNGAAGLAGLSVAETDPLAMNLEEQFQNALQQAQEAQQVVKESVN
eukprot:TRINITY_DN21173_c0_g1_i1.p1 TRINITY_DN21173_c0_g1~~TRINITY_DN21173_c0_g1_i1.p1  ORF type:complete len:716 (-),score=210.88 TRINITY_DN21173_c0_g1_i1:73-2220(-)